MTAHRLGTVVSLLLVAAAAPARAEQGGVGLRDNVRLASAGDVKALCDELRPGADDEERDAAQAGVYVMTIPAAGWGFQDYDTRRARLAVDGLRGFRGKQGVWELSLYDLGAHKAPGSALDMAVPATAKEAAALAKAQRSGQLSLTLWFQVASPPKGGVCAEVHNRDGQGIRLAIEPMAYALSRGKELVASGETEAFAALREAEQPVGEPTVSVAAPVLTNEPGDAPREVGKTARGLADAFLGCYREGLGDDPMLRGTLVIGVVLGTSGHVAKAHAEIDGLGAPGVTACSLAAVKAQRFPDTKDPFSFAITFGD